MVLHPSVSVITPVYNTSQFLRQCLDSLQAQTLEDIEFICVNDGSTDCSLEILQEYAARDSRIRVVDKPNGGYGETLNRGIELAKGEYIGIIESDDFAEPRMFELLYQAAADNDCDIVRANRFDYADGESTFVEILEDLEYDTVFCPADKQEIFVPAPCIWSAIYRRQMIQDNGIRFLETPGASFQDTGFVYKALVACQRMLLLKDALIHYRVDNVSSSVKSSAKMYNICDEFDALDEFLAARPADEQRFRAMFQSLRYQAYRWNYARLSWADKRIFLDRFADEFTALAQAGVLDKTYFSTSAKERVDQLIEDCNAFYERDAPLVSVIIPAYNAEKHLLDTLEHLWNQLLFRTEIIVVDDGSTDNTLAVAQEYAQRDRRVQVIHQENKGVAAARNVGLDNAHGVYVSFIDAEDVLPDNALEELYRCAERMGADMSIGVIREFSPIMVHEFERTVSLSRKQEIDKYDLDMVWSFSVNNKLFKRAKIEELGLRFEEGRLIAEDGLFLMSYAYACDGITGCPTVVLDYRRGLFWDKQSATHTANAQFVDDLIEVHERIMDLARASFEADLAAAESADQTARLQLAKARYEEELHQRLVSYLIDLQYRRLWLLDEEALDRVIEKVEEHKAFLPEKTWQGACAWHRDLDLANGLKTPERIAQSPTVSVVMDLDPGISPDEAALFFDSAYLGTMPHFEVLVPASAKALVPAYYAALPNMRFIEEGEAPFAALALEQARGTFMVFMREAVFPDAGTLRGMLGMCSNSAADFIVGQIAHIDDETWVGWMSQDVVFHPKRLRGFSYETPFNKLDCTLNNKIVKTKALKDKGIALTGNSAKDAKLLYDNLSFQKRPEHVYVTRLTESELLKRFNPVRDASTMLTFVTDHTDLAHVKKFAGRGVDVLKNKTAPMRSSLTRRDTILFFSNRGVFSENLRLVHDRLEGEKVVLVKGIPHSEKYGRYVKHMLDRSKLVVLDDTCHYLRDHTVDLERTKIVQLWHACGAFKKFGLDNYWVPAHLERAKHWQYALMSVSSEPMRSIYAGAFGILPEVVRALGVPRTDLLLDTAYVAAKRAAFFARCPEYVGKKIVLYCPTFRQNRGAQCYWDPKINWEELSKGLPDDVVFVVKAHPLEWVDLLGNRKFGNIATLDDIPTDDVLFAANLLITDYSSIVFDASLLNTPTLFYCPDYESYQTGFYLNFPEDLNGEMVCDFDKLLDAIERALSDGYSFDDAWFKEKFLGACDGQSTERICRFIEDHYL